MRISKQKLESLKKRGRRVGAAVVNQRSTAMEIGTGVAAKYGADLLKQNFKAVADRPWAEAASLGVAGYLMKRSKRTAGLGAAMMGAAGYALGVYLKNRKSSTAAATAPAVAPVAPVAPAAGQTSGFGDTGRVFRFPKQDTGLIFKSAARDVAI